MPGHTMVALGLAGTLDSVRVARTGEDLLAGAMSQLRGAAPIYRSVMRLDSIRTGVEPLLEHEPELLLTGDTGVVPVTRRDLDEFLGWARELGLVVGRLAPVAGLEDEALDPCLARCDPYPTQVVRDGEVGTVVEVRSHAPRAQPATVSLRPLAGWRVEPGPASAAPGRAVVTADVILGGEPRVELAETLVEVVAS